MKTLDIVNTPGYFYALAYWLAAFLIIYIRKKRTFGKKLWIIHIVFFGMIIGFMEYTDGIDTLFFMPSMLVTISMILIYIYICCEFPLINAGYYCVRAFITGEFIASFGWQLYYYSIERFHIGTETLTRFMYLIVMYPIIFCILYWVECRLIEKDEEIHITPRELSIAVVIAAAVFLISNMSYVYKHSPFSSQFNAEIFIIRTLVDMGGMSVLYAYHILIKEVQMKFEVNTLQSILNMQYKNYQLSQESIDIVNQKYHDLKHQIGLLKLASGMQKAVEYLEQMEQEIKIYEAQHKTGNKVLDAVLTSKSLYCQNRGISLTCVADGAVLDFMNDMDISALFGNILDNAIESVEKLKEEEKRLIHLRVVKQRNFLRIHIENYCEKQLTFKNGFPLTTKKDKQFHGYGLKSIQSTAKKYGGSVMADIHNNWFELKVLIPIKKIKN
jgi:hypothetical protein